MKLRVNWKKRKQYREQWFMFLIKLLQGKTNEFLPTYLYFVRNFLTLFLGHLAFLEIFWSPLIFTATTCTYERDWNFTLMYVKHLKIRFIFLLLSYHYILFFVLDIVIVSLLSWSWLKCLWNRLEALKMRLLPWRNPNWLGLLFFINM